MGMPMIAERLFNGESAESIGLSASAYQSRKQTLDDYLAHSGGSFDAQDYLAWLSTSEHGRGQKQNELPNLAKQAVSLGKAVIRHATSGGKKLTAEESAKRMEICEACAYWVEHGTVKLMGKEIEVKRRCSACGCAMDVKATWATSHCIQGKW